MKKEFKTSVPQNQKSFTVHLNRQIPPEAHTPMYNFHKYWSRKTWNVVGKFIETYCPEGGVVLDPFGGSGVTAIEALKAGRRAIICDISPIATELIRLTIKPVNLTDLLAAYSNLISNDKKIKKAREKILELYLTRCRKCGAELHSDCSIWKGGECKGIRYKACPVCDDRQIDLAALDEKDKELLAKIEKHKIKEWFPDYPLYHSNGKPFKEKQRYEKISDLFTKRNLYALAILMEAIEQEENKNIRDFLKIAFSSMVHLCTRMTPVRPTRPTSSAWTEHSYWFADEFMEQNVWEKFESSMIGHQGLIKAKEESNKYFQKIKFATTLKQFVKNKSDILIYTGSCLDLMKEIRKTFDISIIDYIFTDPPYDSSIQYGELSFMWVAWLKMADGYLDKMAADEIIHNDRQNKDFEVYHSLIKHSFELMFDVLKPESYLTVTFHNPTFKVRNATIRAGVLNGFDLQKIHHQELARSSAKSLLQPFGSAQGDFYLRFFKPEFPASDSARETIDEIRFEKIVLDTAVMIMAERGEPTPYTIIINAIDPELAKRGFFGELHTGLDVKTVLEKHLDDEFILVDSKIGGATGKLWWLKNPQMVPHLESVPISDRVEKTVLSKLQQMGKISFTEIWEAVSVAFPNSLTTDQTSLREALEIYAAHVRGGEWLIKTCFKPEEAERTHTTAIALLAEIGIKNGYDICIGKIERSHQINTAYLKKTGTLGEYATFDKVFLLKNIINAEIVDDIDLLWIKDDKIEFLFEVECTTSMTSALQRGSNVEKEAGKILLFPMERENQFANKMKNPLFCQNFNDNNWKYIVIDELHSAWNKKKNDLNIHDLFNKPFSGTKIKYDAEKDKNQMSLFEWQEEYKVDLIEENNNGEEDEQEI